MRKVWVILTTLGLVSGGFALDAHAAVADSRRVLDGSVPSWATASNRIGTSDAKRPVAFRVYLPWRDSDAAASYALQASTPSSVGAGTFLTPSQFRDRFAPASGDVTTITSWLKHSGFTVGYVPANRHYVEAKGTVAQAATAFATRFSDYGYQGTVLQAPDVPLSVPTTLPAVAAVVGLDDSDALVKPEKSTSAPPPDAFVNARPCSVYWGEKTVGSTPTPDGTQLPTSPDYAFAPCGYTPAQLQGAYGIASALQSGNDGRGVTVAVIDAYASPTIQSDLTTYSSLHGLPPITGLFRQVVAPGTFRRPQNRSQDPQGWSGEETLDLEAVHTMAPGASMVYVGAANNYQDLDAAMNHVVDQHLADIVTNSYGFSTELLPQGYIRPFNDTLIQAAAEGISVLFSSGDNGDETNADPNTSPTPDWPASSPWVTAVGGTTMGVDAANGRQFELGWETGRAALVNGAWDTYNYLYGSGGGTSRQFAQPSYQAGVVPNDIATRNGGAPARVVPDIAALGDPTTGMLIGQTQRFPDGDVRYSEYRIGGTSLASPLVAGLLALADQRRGAPIGFANPTLYRAAGTAAFHDITKSELSVYPGAARVDYINQVDASDGYLYTARSFDQDDALTIHVRPGYDDVTGIGTPNGDAWLTAVAG